MRCRRCDQQKDASEFPPHKAYATGHSTWCRECHKAANREWYQENKAKQNAKAVAWRVQNKLAAAGIDRRFKEKNRDRIAASNAAWTRDNRDKRRATTAKRKAVKLVATPAWANPDAIARIYRLARELQELTGVPIHVDHVVPLQHPLVYGKDARLPAQETAFRGRIQAQAQGGDAPMSNPARAVSPYSVYIGDEVRKARAMPAGHSCQVIIRRRLRQLEADGLVSCSGSPKGLYGFFWALTPAGMAELDADPGPIPTDIGDGAGPL